MAKRYHLSKHDRAVDRRNLEHARMARKHESEGMKKHDARLHGHHGDHYAEHHTLYKPHAETRSSHEKQMYNDEHHSDRGMERAPVNRYREMSTGLDMYAGMEPRRRQEMEDAGMIHEDHSQIANLPQGVIMKPYPATGPYLPEGLNDDIRGVDHQMDYDDSQRRAHFYPKKV